MQLRDSIEATGSFFLYSILGSERCDSYACRMLACGLAGLAGVRHG